MFRPSGLLFVPFLSKRDSGHVYTLQHVVFVMFLNKVQRD